MTLSGGQCRRHLAEAIVDLKAAAAMIGAGNLARLYEAQRGPKAAAYDGMPRSRNNGSGDIGTSNDRAAADLTLHDQLVERLGRDASQLRRLYAAYDPPRHANEADRLALARENRPPGPTCQHCATIKEPFGDGPYRVDADHRRKGPTTVAGRLPEPLVLCAWCADFTAAHDRLPSARQLEQHRDGRRVMVADDTPRRAS